MNNYNEKLISLLSKLIKTSKETEFCYKTAAEEIGVEDLKTVFTIYSSQRGDFSKELENAAKKITEKEIELNFENLQLTYNKIKSLFSKSDRTTILSECDRLESNAKKLYKESLSANLPPDLKEIIEDQYKEILEASDKIKLIKNSR